MDSCRSAAAQKRSIAFAQNTNGIMIWAWMLWSAYALGTRRESCFGHGCSGQRMRLEHEANYGLSMDALVSVCSWNTKGIMVWAWMLWSACALGTRRELWFGHGCSGQRTHRNTNGIMVWAWMLWSAHSSKHERNYGLGMDALVSVCSWNTKGIMVWAWMLWSAYALGTRSELWFGHGCSCQRLLLEHEGNHGLGMDALVSALIETRTELWFGHGCSGQRTHRNTNGIMVWAWMLWSAHSSKHERNYGLGMDALVSALIETRTELWFEHGCSGQRTHRNTKGIMVWAWMLWSAHSSKHDGN